jgi:hypothetical protein
MRNGIYSFDITSGETASKGIAMVEKNVLRGLDWGHAYTVERSTKHGKPRWSVEAHRYMSGTPGVYRGGFPAILEGEEGEDQFNFKGTADGDINIKVAILKGIGFTISP